MSQAEVLQFFRDFDKDESQRKVLCESVDSPASFVRFANQYGYHFTEKELREELHDVWNEWNRVEIPPGSGSSASLIKELFRLLRREGKI